MMTLLITATHEEQGHHAQPKGANQQQGRCSGNTQNDKTCQDINTSMKCTCTSCVGTHASVQLPTVVAAFETDVCAPAHVVHILVKRGVEGGDGAGSMVRACPWGRAKVLQGVRQGGCKGLWRGHTPTTRHGIVPHRCRGPAAHPPNMHEQFPNLSNTHTHTHTHTRPAPPGV